MNVAINCVCGCGEIVPLDSRRRIRKFVPGHKGRVIVPAMVGRPAWNKGIKGSTTGRRTSEESKIASRERSRLRYRTNATYARSCKSRTLKSQIGIGLDEYDALLIVQKNLCAACQKPLDFSGRRPPVDHDHETGKIRGIVHKGCNIALGEVNDDPDTLRALADYIERKKK